MKPRDIALVVSLVVIFSVTAGKCYSGQRAEWEARITRVEEHNRGLERQRREAVARADSLQAANDSLVARTDAEAPLIRERIVVVRDSTPAGIAEHPAVVARDSIIDDLLGESARYRTAYMRERAASASLRVALKATVAARDSLQAVIDDRPGGRLWFIPRVGVGVAAGLDAGGKPRTVAGATLSWEIGL